MGKKWRKEGGERKEERKGGGKEGERGRKVRNRLFSRRRGFTAPFGQNG